VFGVNADSVFFDYCAVTLLEKLSVAKAKFAGLIRVEHEVLGNVVHSAQGSQRISNNGNKKFLDLL